MDWAKEDDEWLVDRDGDQVMPQDEIKMVPEEYTDMEVNGMTAGGMMTALHTSFAWNIVYKIYTGQDSMQHGVRG